MSEPGLSARDEVAILLAEYGMLRDELLQRNTMLNQTFLIAATVGTAIIGLTLTPLWELSVILFVVSPIPLAFVASLIRFDTYSAAARIREIETAVNQIANKRLLVWETDQGRYNIGILRRVLWVISGASETDARIRGNNSNDDPAD